MTSRMPHEPTERPIPQGRLRRAAPLAGFAARTAGEGVIAALRAKTGKPDAKAAFHERTAERYSALLGHSKGVLMKAGQLLSFGELGALNPDSSFSLYQAALERLQADAPPMDSAMACAIVEESLGKPLDEVFASGSSSGRSGGSTSSTATRIQATTASASTAPWASSTSAA